MARLFEIREGNIWESSVTSLEFRRVPLRHTPLPSRRDTSFNLATGILFRLRIRRINAYARA